MKTRVSRPALLALCLAPFTAVLAQQAPPPPPAAPGAVSPPVALPPDSGAPAGPIGGDKFENDKQRQAYALGILLAAQQKARQADQPDAKPADIDEVVAGLRDVLGGEKTLDYALGVSFAGTIKRSEIEVDVDSLVEAMRASLTGGETKLTQQQSQQVVTQINQQTQQRQQAKQKEIAAKSLVEATAWLETNGTVEGVKKTESGVQYKIEKEGEGTVPGEGDIVTITYRGTLTNGDEFERSPEGQPAKRPIRMLPKGLQEGLRLVKTGGKIKLWVPPALGFGESKRGSVKPNSVLIYDVELVAATTPPAPAPAPTFDPANPNRQPITATTPPVAVEIPPMKEDKAKPEEKKPEEKK